MYGLILDVVVLVVVVLFVIFGIWRGMYKLIYGLISSLAAIVVAVLLASMVTGFVIDKTTLDDLLVKSLDEPIQKAVPAQLDASNVTIEVFAQETDGKKYVVKYDGDAYDSLTVYLTEKGGSLSPVYSFFGKVLEGMFSNDTALKMLNPDYTTDTTTESAGSSVNVTLAQAISTVAIVYIMLAGVFIVLWIVAYIVIRLLMYVVKRIVHGTYIGHFLDKVLGLVIGAGFAMIIVWGILAIIRLLGTYTWIIPVNELIDSSTVTKFLYNNNYLYNFLVSSTDLQKSIAELIGKFGSTGSTGTTETTARFLRDSATLISGL